MHTATSQAIKFVVFQYDVVFSGLLTEMCSWAFDREDYERAKEIEL